MYDKISEDIQQQAADDLQFCVIRDEDGIKKLSQIAEYLNREKFSDICKLYGYPLTVVVQLRYVDKMYRDAYYIYLAHLHFDMKRDCKRLSLFRGIKKASEFFDIDKQEELQGDFLGTIVVRPSYNYTTEYTMGRTLLNPYKMKNPIKYLRTAEYKVTICGQKYSIDAFPFCNQHSDVLRCAETSVWALMEYYGRKYDNYSTILPSTILNWSAGKLSAHSLPSDGLTYEQISGLLKSFNFEPRIYLRYDYMDNANDRQKENYDRERKILLKNLFHYYIDSGIPIITALSDTRNDINHSIVVIGHGERNSLKEKDDYIKADYFQYGDLFFFDASTFYDEYIVIDDNQIPYQKERYDQFSELKNRKVEAFIVPLYRHILLDAISAVNIIEMVYKKSGNLIKSSLKQLKEEGDEEKEGIEYKGNI